jgi:hypothetical protein
LVQAPVIFTIAFAIFRGKGQKKMKATGRSGPAIARSATMKPFIFVNHNPRKGESKGLPVDIVWLEGIMP